MRTLAPVRVSYLHDFLISYRFYMMTGLFHILLFEGTLHVDKVHLWYHVNKYRAVRENWSELAPGRKSSRNHVNTP